ncbi:copper amine oxidase [Drepanopeziza brunnea f. sp. 'multigermtubi' MB_m1]|uniref:Amine oxidase n=1 Tax=Marssonina brunnea f. sp. multigermtubi (strain MB_m1) TaxID=1072389 RepID=K1WV06_MARBU|nr:copper amine oxidase [Drepanopeziza brunnea f. sp. 'multigermtubi' MB_m1]EKD12478.1 copper amine oxidase [Drepanopeziza brunnea f. sp. 'multigermtubi' MB_m1]
MSAEPTTTGQLRPDGAKTLLHPLDQLSIVESDLLVKSFSWSSRPARIAKIQYDVLQADRRAEYMESCVDIASGKEVHQRIIDKVHHGSLTSVCEPPLFKKAVSEFDLPEGFVVTVDSPYGRPDPSEIAPRYTQGLCFAKDARSGNEDSNRYGYPLPIISVMDSYTIVIVRIDSLATGGKEDGLSYGTHKKNVIDHCAPSKYVPELLSQPLRTNVKPLNVTQPEGPSFQVNGNLVQWQKWRFRVGFNPREGATLHDVRYDGRIVLYRLSLGEMTVPYGDPRPLFQRKQAFDSGDARAGRAANNLPLGCDCLGTIKYFDAVLTDPDGKAILSKNVVCLHEQDNGIGWKQTNFRTSRAVVIRLRELLDQAGGITVGITVETRATGIVSVVNIDPGKTSPWGNVVSSGALAQNHQHLFCIRIDPAIDGLNNTKINPYGSGYEVRQIPIKKSHYLDALPFTNLTIKITNPSKLNPVSGKPVVYKFIPSATQLLLAHPEGTMAKRAQFTTHHVWVTKYKDGKFGPHNPRVEEWPVMPVEIHQLHLRPADFFTANPAIDVPGSKNTPSVLADPENFLL